MEARLVIYQDEELVSNLILDSSQRTSIGRHPSCTVCFQDTKISAKHCIIESKGDYFYIIDQNSTNGTYVNGSRVRVRRLYDGDTILCGTIKIKFDWFSAEESDHDDIIFTDIDTDDGYRNSNVDDGRYYRIGDYIVLEKIGQGGIGEVYKAEHITSPGIEVAIKLLTPTAQQNKTLVERFLREAKACIALDHPRIIKVFEVDTYRERPYFVMEYVQGDTLDKFLKKKGALSPVNVLKIAGHIAHALDYAHSYHIIHRDLKPGNILVEAQGYHVKLIDLGLAKMLDQSRLTLTSRLVGTPRYMAPEQMRDSKDIDTRADIYALGATMYHMTTGIAPYAEIISSNRSALLRYMYTKSPMPIAELVDVPREMTQLIYKAMAKKKELRFHSAKEIFHAISDTLHKLSHGYTSLRSRN